MIIDSHVHIWTHAAEYPWAPGEADIPSFDADPAELIKLMKTNGIGRAVLIQYIKYRWDNSYLANILKLDPQSYIGVCRVNPEDANSPDHLSYWTEVHGFQGVRLGPPADLNVDWFQASRLVPLFKRAADLKVPIFILTGHEHLNDLVRMVDRVPEVDTVIDHLADCINQPEFVLERLFDLARFPHVFLKLGHIPNFSSQSYPWADTHQSLEKIIRYFGVERILWGSDWPFCLSQLTYTQSLTLINEGLRFLNKEEKEWILGRTASKIWTSKPISDS